MTKPLNLWKINMIPSIKLKRKINFWLILYLIPFFDHQIILQKRYLLQFYFFGFIFSMISFIWDIFQKIWCTRGQDTDICFFFFSLNVTFRTFLFLIWSSSVELLVKLISNQKNRWSKRERENQTILLLDFGNWLLTSINV